MSQAEHRRGPVRKLVTVGLLAPLVSLPVGDYPGRTEEIGTRNPSRGSAVVDCTTGKALLRLQIPPDPHLVVDVPNTGINVVIDRGTVTGVVVNPGGNEPFRATAGGGGVRITRTDAPGNPTVVFESNPGGSEVVITGECAPSS